MISASHNLYADNGIKFFGGDGFKLSDETEQEIELHIDEDAGGGGTQIGRIHEMRGTSEDYLRELESRFSGAVARRAGPRPRLRQRRHLPASRRRSSGAWAPL